MTVGILLWFNTKSLKACSLGTNCVLEAKKITFVDGVKILVNHRLCAFVSHAGTETCSIEVIMCGYHMYWDAALWELLRLVDFINCMPVGKCNEVKVDLCNLQY